MRNETVIRLIIAYMEECVFEPKTWRAKCCFEQYAYSQWAASEILELVMDNPLTSPDEIVCGFMLKMVIYSKASESKEKRFMFSTARDTAEDILNLF